MRIIFCNIAYMRYYDGRVSGEIKPSTGGSWVSENEDAHEKMNFLNVDGMCYGYVQATGSQMHIEKLDKIYKQQDEADDVTVIWCASHHTRGTVVVGWYEHAKIYRYVQDMLVTPLTGIERFYWFSTKAENAYLLPEEERTLVIGRAAVNGTGKGFGQSNYWYAESKYAKDKIIPKVLDMIRKNRNKRVNVLSCKFEKPQSLKPLTKEEKIYAEEIDEDENMEFLPYAYRMYEENSIADNAYKIAVTLKNLYQYKKSIEWYEKTIELDPEDLDTKGILMYVYTQCEQYEKAINIAKELLKSSRVKEGRYRDEVYCAIADAYYYSDNIKEAVKWQEKILEESNDKDLIEHTKRVKQIWEEN